MRLFAKTFLVALIALGPAGLASAETPVSMPGAPDFSAVAGMELDGVFEQSLDSEMALTTRELAGPTSMVCEPGEVREVTETCVVTIDGMPSSMPAAFAHN